MSLENALKNHKILDFFKNLSTQEEVSENLNTLDVAYYNGNPLLPDSTYDAVRSYCQVRFPELKKKVGKKENVDEMSIWPKTALRMKMGSLDKENTPAALKKWHNKYTQGTVVSSHKVDGLSVELTFENGVFVKGITRGDGFEGDDITPNVRKMKFPKTIPEKGLVEVRSEIVLLRDDFEKHFAPLGYKNARNTSAGTARKPEGRTEHLSLVAFDVLSDEVEFKTKIDKFNFLHKLGFIVPNPLVLKHFEAMEQVIAYNTLNRKLIPYDIDGIVFEENDLTFFEEQGESDNKPRSAIAFKFENETVDTTLQSVVWQVGKTGSLTPVGQITPADIQGVTISRVMLNNLSHIDELGLELGSRVTLMRANDVIPKIKNTLTKTGNKIVPPSKCPSCGSLLNATDPKHITCENHEECPAQTAYRIVAFLDVLGVRGMGDKIIEKLLDASLIRDCADLYTLDIDKASEIEGMSKSILQKSYRELIQKSSKVTLPKFIKSVSMKNIGESATEKVMVLYPTIHDLFNIKSEDIIKIEGIGDSIAADFVLGINSKKELILKLLNYITITAQAQGPLTDMTFVFTGFRDGALEEKIREKGGNIGASVSKTTTHLVCASTASLSTKAVKAQKEGKIIMSKKELEEMLEQ